MRTLVCELKGEEPNREQIRAGAQRKQGSRALHYLEVCCKLIWDELYSVRLGEGGGHPSFELGLLFSTAS